MNKLFIFNRIALIAGLLLTLGLLKNCAKSSEVKAIAANQSNENDKKPMNSPTTNSDDKDEFPPVDSSKIPTVTYCDLIKNARDYDKKIVRVRAIYFSGFEKIYLYDNRCETNELPSADETVPSETWAERDKSFVSKGDSAETKLNRQLDGFGRKDVTVVGRFYSTNENGDEGAPNLFGHLNCCRFQLSIMRVESVNNLDGKAAKTVTDYGKPIEFAPAQKLEFADFTLEFSGQTKMLVAVPQPDKKPPEYYFRISRNDKSLIVWGNDTSDSAPLEFEFGGANYQLESGISDRSGKLAKDELIVRKIN